MKKIIDWWNDRKESSRKNEIENVRFDFKVAERNGKIYLMHKGYAFAVIAKDMSASEIAAKLNEARKAALEFEGL